MIAIYKITNRLNGKPYVGQTCQMIEKRFIQHSKDKTPLGNAMRQCGLENFTLELIETCETQSQANERFGIKTLNCKVPNGYNRSNGGGCGIRKPKAMFVMAIGKNIKNLCLQHGFSQAELAKIAGVSDKAVSSWEQNKSVPRMGAIQEMADFFGVQKSVTIETTFDPNDTIESRLAKNSLSLNIEKTNLVFNYRNLNVNNRQIIDVMMALFLSQQSGGEDFDLNVAAV